MLRYAVVTTPQFQWFCTTGQSPLYSEQQHSMRWLSDPVCSNLSKAAISIQGWVRERLRHHALTFFVQTWQWHIMNLFTFHWSEIGRLRSAGFCILERGGNQKLVYNDNGYCRPILYNYLTLQIIRLRPTWIGHMNSCTADNGRAWPGTKIRLFSKPVLLTIIQYYFY